MSIRSFGIPAGMAVGASLSGCESIVGEWEGRVYAGTIIPIEQSYSYDGYSYSFNVTGGLDVKADGSVELSLDFVYSYDGQEESYSYSYEGDFERKGSREYTITLDNDGDELQLDCAHRGSSVLDCLDDDDNVFTWER